MGELPWLTATIAAFAVAAGISPALAPLLEYDRALIADGQAFRLVTGHLVHWSFDHWLRDVVMFAALGAFLERHSRRLLVSTLAVSTAFISAALWFLEPEVLVYRGLSGLDSALFAAVLSVALVEALRVRHTLLLLAVSSIGGGFLAKLAYEVISGGTLFVDSAAAGFVPLPLVHAVGAVAGMLTVAAASLSWRRTRSLMAAWNLPA